MEKNVSEYLFTLTVLSVKRNRTKISSKRPEDQAKKVGMFYRLHRFLLLSGILVTLLILSGQLNRPNGIPISHRFQTTENPTSLLTIRVDSTVTTESTAQTFPTTTTTTTSIAAIVKGAHDWFQGVISNVDHVHQWSSDKLDRQLHHLSHWSHLDATGWRAFVNKTINRLDPPMSPKKSFTFFELGVGVGAFSRRLLLQYPYAQGIGIDVVQSAVDVARTILPSERMKLYTVSNNEYPMIANNTVDHIIAPGVLCYLPSLDSIERLMRELVRVAKPGASMAFTMIPYDVAGRVSCHIFILPSFWSGNSIKSLGLQVTSIQNMSEWNLAHSHNRYAVYLR